MAREGAWAPLRHRDFALLWSGQSVSLVGDGIFLVALALEALMLNHSPRALSVVIAARLLPTVCLLLLGGVVVDRVPRRLAMLASDLIRGIAVGVIAVLVALGALHLWELITMAVIFGTADAFFYPASTAVVPELLPPDLLVQGSAMTGTSRTAAQLFIGPAIGGLVVGALGTAWAFGFDAASFAVSATCLVLMTSRPRPAASGRSPLHDVRAGLRYCGSQPWLWASIVGAGIANFASLAPLAVLLPLLVREVLRASPLALGLVFAADGLGGVAVSLLVAHFGAPRRRITAMWLGWGLASVAVCGIALSPGIWIVGLFGLVAGALLMYGNVLWSPLMQELVPPELIGRAASVDWLVSLGLTPLGVLAAGAVAGAIGTRQTMLAGGVVALLATAVLFLPGVRDPERGPRFGPEEGESPAGA